MKGQLLSNKEVEIINRKFAIFDEKRNVMLRSGKPMYEVDSELSKEIDSLLLSTKPIENAKFNNDYDKANCLYKYLYIRNIKYSLKIYELGLTDKNGQKLLEDENGIVKFDEDVIKSIREIIKNLMPLYNRFSQLLSSNKEDKIINNKEINVQFRFLLQKMGELFFLIDDIDNSIKYYSEAFIKYESKAAAYSLLCIHVKIEQYEDVNKSEFFYNFLMNSPLDDLNNKNVHIQMKLMATSILYHYYYSNGDLENAFNKANDSLQLCKKYDITGPLLDYSIEKFNDVKLRLKQVSDVIIDDECLMNEGYFSKFSLDLMSKDIKVFIQTSIKLYNQFKDLNYTFDYSSVNIPILKGVETLLYKIFCFDYFDYLKSIKDINLQKVDYFYRVQIDEKWYWKETIERIEYGDAVHIACYVIRPKDLNAIYKPKEKFVKFCKEVCGMMNAENTIIDFISKLDNIRTIRNKTAHRFRVLKQDADECRNQLYVVTKFIDDIYTNFHAIFESESIKEKYL